MLTDRLKKAKEPARDEKIQKQDSPVSDAGESSAKESLTKPKVPKKQQPANCQDDHKQTKRPKTAVAAEQEEQRGEDEGSSTPPQVPAEKPPPPRIVFNAKHRFAGHCNESVSLIKRRSALGNGGRQVLMAKLSLFHVLLSGKK